jgi:hypothetical protein
MVERIGAAGTSIQLRYFAEREIQADGFNTNIMSVRKILHDK